MTKAPSIRLPGGQLARIEFHDKGPDDFGRRHYSLHWPDVRGEPIYMGGKVVAPAGPYERGQHFFGIPPEPALDACGLCDAFPHTPGPQHAYSCSEWRRDGED